MAEPKNRRLVTEKRGFRVKPIKHPRYSRFLRTSSQVARFAAANQARAICKGVPESKGRGQDGQEKAECEATVTSERFATVWSYCAVIYRSTALEISTPSI
jgi:hypothetical protein